LAGSCRVRSCPAAGNPRVKAYVSAMAKLSVKPSTLGAIALIVPLLALLVAALWFAAQAWISVSGPPMPAAGYIAMALGVVFSVVLGGGLMALLFYSNRHGYDDIGHREPYRPESDRD